MEIEKKELSAEERIKLLEVQVEALFKRVAELEKQNSDLSYQLRCVEQRMNKNHLR